MKPKTSMKPLSPKFNEAPVFPAHVLNWIAEQNLWNLWVPKAYNGLESSFTEGLRKLQNLAKTDGSLSWTVTLCSGANYFIGNLKPEVADDIFLTTKQPICFGGSGGVCGEAEQQGDHYIISGEWHYATGAPYLSHFTLSARIMADKKPVLHKDGTPVIKSFVIPKNQVSIIKNWNTMGLKATATHSFKVNAVIVPSKYAFTYNQFYLPQPIFKIPFSVFADLTLWVNYLGMAEHFLEEATPILELDILEPILLMLSKTNQTIYKFAQEIELFTTNETVITETYTSNIHATAVASIKEISKSILDIYPLLGVNASRENQPLNRIFRNYFTATQHHIFSRK